MDNVSEEEVVEAAKSALETHGFGMSSVRFICGTQDIHKELEQRIADFYQTEDTILYAAAFDANGGLFEPLFGPEDAIISDEDITDDNRNFLELNERLSKKWPVLTEFKDAPEDAKEWENKENKLQFLEE